MGATGRSGAKAKAGLVRAITADKGSEADARHWPGNVSREYRSKEGAGARDWRGGPFVDGAGFAEGNRVKVMPIELGQGKGAEGFRRKVL
jgi:hypothetical protein